MKAKITVWTIALAVVLAAFWAWRGEPSQLADVAEIGCLTPLTGDGATYGGATKRGVDLAVDETNQGGGLQMSVLYEDDRMTPATAIGGLRKLISFHKVPVIIGAFGSSVTLAVAPIAESEKTVLFSASSTADAIADAGEYIFRNVPTNKTQGATAARFALNQLGARRAVVLAMNNDYGRSLSDAFRAVYVEGGGKITFEDTYSGGDKDFRAQLQKIKVDPVPVVFFPGHYAESAPILRQARELGITSIFIGGDGSYSPELITAAGAAAEGSYYTLMAVDFSAAPAQSFAEKFKERYGQEPDVYAAYAYDAAMLIFKLLREGNRDAAALKEALYRSSGFEGVTGLTKFDPQGEVNKPFSVQVVKNGKFVPVEKQ